MAGFAIYCRHIIVKAAPAAITGPFQSAGAAPIKAFTRKMGRKKMKERKISPKKSQNVFIGVDEKVTSSWKRKKDDTNKEGNGGENSNKTILRGSGSST